MIIQPVTSPFPPRRRADPLTEIACLLLCALGIMIMIPIGVVLMAVLWAADGIERMVSKPALRR